MLFKTDSELAIELGRRARTYRIRKGMSQRTLAQKAGVHVNTMRGFERRGEVKLSSFIAILRALGERRLLESMLDAPPPRDLYAQEPKDSPLPQRVRERRP
jgi:transcriptional regulator with XRE-family HTH domain